MTVDSPRYRLVDEQLDGYGRHGQMNLPNRSQSRVLLNQSLEPEFSSETRLIGSIRTLGSASLH